MAIDYGKRRTGIAVTDDLQIIASGLETVETPQLFIFFKKYFSKNEVDEVVVGLPIDLTGNLNKVEDEIDGFLKKFKAEYPEKKINRMDERFTSKMASYYISQSGKSKKARESKSLIDMVSATLILQSFLDRK